MRRSAAKGSFENAEAFANFLEFVTAVPCGQEVSRKGESESQAGQEIEQKDRLCCHLFWLHMAIWLDGSVCVKENSA